MANRATHIAIAAISAVLVVRLQTDECVGVLTEICVSILSGVFELFA